MYFENKKIIEIVDGYKEGVKRIQLEDCSFEIPEWEIIATQTEEVSNPSDGRNSRGNYVAEQILKLLKELDIRVEEAGFYLQKVVNSLQDTEGIAILNAFGFYPKTQEERGEIKNRMRLSDWETKLYGK